MSARVFLCDLTKTDHINLAIANRGERPESSDQYAVRTLEEFEKAIDTYLDEHDCPDLMAAAFCAPGWEVAGGLSMPNNGFKVERERLKQVLNIKRLHLVNSCVSVAMAVQSLRPQDTQLLCGKPDDLGLVKGFIRCAKGLGVAGIVPDENGPWQVLPSEGGHSDLAATNERESLVLTEIIKKYGHASRERVISVPGLTNVYRSLSIIDGDGAIELKPQDIVDLAHKKDKRACETVNLVFDAMASFAGDVCLMIGAQGGLYVCGELLEIAGDLMDIERFEARFCDKGRVSGYLKDVPIYRIVHKQPEFVGLMSLFS